MIQLSVQQANTAGAGLSPPPRPMMPVACGSPLALMPGATRPVAQAVEERKDAELFGWTRIVPRPDPTLAAWSVACGHTLHAWFSVSFRETRCDDRWQRSIFNAILSSIITWFEPLPQMVFHLHNTDEKAGLLPPSRLRRLALLLFRWTTVATLAAWT